MGETDFALPPPLDTASAGGKLSGFPAGSRTRRRTLVAATLICADLGSGFVATQLAGLFTGATFKIGMGAPPALLLGLRRRPVARCPDGRVSRRRMGRASA